ncbi:MAG: CopG family transcriptional regulator [Acidobacteriota bacterium]
MRTTLTLEPDLAAKLKELARQRKTSFKQEVNEAIRIGLSARSKPVGKRSRFRVKPSHCGFRPGVDTGKLNQLLDELDAEDFRSESRP